MSEMLLEMYDRTDRLRNDPDRSIGVERCFSYSSSKKSTRGIDTTTRNMQESREHIVVFLCRSHRLAQTRVHAERYSCRPTIRRRLKGSTGGRAALPPIYPIPGASTTHPTFDRS